MSLEGFATQAYMTRNARQEETRGVEFFYHDISIRLSIEETGRLAERLMSAASEASRMRWRENEATRIFPAHTAGPTVVGPPGRGGCR